MWSPTQSVCSIIISVICSLVLVRSDGESITINHSDRIENLEQSSLIYEIFKEIRLNEESECAHDINVILDGIQNRDVWALKSNEICLYQTALLKF